MHWIWLAIAVVAGAPLAYVSFLTNPLVLFALGYERWREQLLRLRPYRGWIGFLVAIFGFAIAMFVLSG
jgi:hypothetical protein